VAKRVSGRAFLVGAAVAVAGLATEAVVAWVRKEAPPVWAPIAAPVVTVLLAGVTAVAEKDRGAAQPLPAAANPGQPGYPGQPAYPGYGPPPAGPASTRTRRHGYGLPFALVVLLVLFGLGGWAASVHVPKVVLALQNEGLPPWERPLGDGTERLAQPGQGASQGVTVSVSSVMVYDAETVLTLSVHNDNGDAVSLPVFGAVTLAVDGAPTLRPDLERTDPTWSSTVGAGSDSNGSIAFTGALASGATGATLVFTNVLTGTAAATIQVPLALTG
jgi:hypothetical protein